MVGYFIFIFIDEAKVLSLEKSMGDKKGDEFKDKNKLCLILTYDKVEV